MKFLYLIILLLTLVIVFTNGYHIGNRDGYNEAMSDAFLGVQSPEEFFNVLVKTNNKRKSIQ